MLQKPSVVHGIHQRFVAGTVLRCLSLSIVSRAGAFKSLNVPKTSSSMPRLRSTSSSNECSVVMAGTMSSQNAPAVPVGGDFCGISATFFPDDGTYMPIPEFLIPKEMLEWGQAPSGLEILVSEDEFDNRNRVWEKQLITIYPATGCTVDNMETKKNTEEIDMYNIWQNGSNRHVSTQQTLNYFETNIICVETFFGFEDLSDHRMRVTVNLEVNQDNLAMTVSKPVTIVLERQVKPTSSHGSFADGGGVQGNDVSRMLGETLNKKRNFATEKVNQLVWNERNGTVFFPGNATLLFESTENGYSLEVGQITLVSPSSSNQFNFKYHHHVVRRIFYSPTNTKVESYIRQLNENKVESVVVEPTRI